MQIPPVTINLLQHGGSFIAASGKVYSISPFTALSDLHRTGYNRSPNHCLKIIKHYPKTELFKSMVKQ